MNSVSCIILGLLIFLNNLLLGSNIVIENLIKGEKLYDISKMQFRGELVYAPNEKEGFSGWYKVLKPGGEVTDLFQFKNGYLIRLLHFYDTGQVGFDISINASLMPKLESYELKLTDPDFLVSENYLIKLFCTEESFYEGLYFDTNFFELVKNSQYSEHFRSFSKLISNAEFYYSNGQISYKYTSDKGSLELKSFSVSGDPLRYYNFLKDGTEVLVNYISYYQNSQKATEYNFKNSRLEIIENFKPNGEICDKTNLNDGNGIFVNYNENGLPLFQYTFSNGELIKVKGFYDNGEVHLLENYYNGQLNGKYLKITDHSLFENKNLDGLFRYEGFYEKGEKVGKWIEETYPDCQIRKSIDFLNGEIHGEYIEYDSKGRVVINSNYLEGKLNGEYKKFNHLGEIIESSNYLNGLLHGSQMKIVAEGITFSVFENGKEINSSTVLNSDPIPISREAPRYPIMAKADGIEGYVIARFVVDELGKVDSVWIQESSSSIFEKSVIEAIKKWSFKPATKNNKNVKAVISVKIPFSIVKK